MSANLMSTMYSHKEMPWHKDAYVSQTSIGAVEASSVIESVFFVKRPVIVELNDEFIETDNFAIIRSPIPSDPRERILGFVKNEYNILQPNSICQKFDENVCEPVETLGFLGNGERMFLTWVLPGFNVNGDEVKLFGFVACGYDGKFGASLYIVSVRVVCANTFAMAVNEGERNKNSGQGKIWSGRHNSQNLERDLGIWMEHVQAKAITKSRYIIELFGGMASKRIEDETTLADLLFGIYPDPNPLPIDFPERLRNEKQEKINIVANKAAKDREIISSLFGGQGIAITPDGFGLFNAVTQYENHVRVTKKPSEYSILFGNRATTMARAADVISNWTLKD